jgi:HEPN domain-containing protein
MQAAEMGFGWEANMPARYTDWFRQAKRDLVHARHAAEDGEYEWACFAAQQSAEKGVKAAFMRRNSL